MEYFQLVIRLTSKEHLTKKHILHVRSYGVGSYGNTPRAYAAHPIHSIQTSRLPLGSKFDDNELQRDACKQYKSMHSGPLHFYSRSSRMSNNFPSSDKGILGESVLGISRQHTSRGIHGNPKLENLPKYIKVEREKPKLSWWKKLCNCKKEEEIEFCGEPISLVPEDIEDEINRQKCLALKKRFIHPLVDRIGCPPPSFKPKDMPGPFNETKGDENKKPTKKSWIKNLFSKEPKTEVVYPSTIPQAKVMTYEELCYSIKNMLMTPARYDCGRRYPDLCFQDVPTPFYSEGRRSNCDLKTFVSPSLTKPTTFSLTPKTPSIPEIQGQSHEKIHPATPTKMACDGKTPIDEISPPFYSECADLNPKPTPCYSDCKNDSSYCLPFESTDKFKEKEPRKQPHKHFSECTPQLHPANKLNKNQ